MKRMISVSLASGVVGILLGSAPYAMMQLNGYELTKSASARTGASAAMPASGGGPAMGGCPMMAARMKEMEEANEPRPKRDLATLVRKLELLTGDIGITLSAAQANTVNDCLKDLEKPAKMSDGDAKPKLDRLMAALNDKQKARLVAIAIPKPARSDGPEMGAGMPGMAGGMPGMMGGAPGPAQDENQNPFQQDAEGKAVKSLRERFASKGAGAKTEAPKAPPAKAEAPKAPPPKADASKSPAAKS